MIIFASDPVDREEKKVLEWCIKNHYNYQIVPIKHILRKQFLINKDTCPVGDIPYVHSCLKQVNITIKDNCYPEELKPFLKRNITETIVKKLPHQYPFFIKPSQRTKKFTGRIINFENELYGISKNEYVWISTVKPIKSEWRIYVINKNNRFLSFCDGDKTYQPDHNIINDIFKNLPYCP